MQNEDIIEISILRRIEKAKLELSEGERDLMIHREMKKKYGLIPLAPGTTINHSVRRVRKSGMPSIPNSYSDNNTWFERCLYVLSILGECFTEDVITEIARFEPNTPQKTIKDAVTNKLSKMAVMGWIDVNKEGNKNKYKLKQPIK